MNVLDLIILVVLAAGVVHGFSTGLIRQVTSVIGLVVSFVLAVQLMGPVGQLTVDSLGISDRMAPLVGFVVVFLGVTIVLFVLTRMAESLIKALRLTSVNRLLGGAFGAFKGALVLSVAFLVLGQAGVPGEASRTQSVLYEPVAGVLPGAWDYVTEYLPDVEKIADRFGEGVGGALEEAFPSENP